MLVTPNRDARRSERETRRQAVSEAEEFWRTGLLGRDGVWWLIRSQAPSRGLIVWVHGLLGSYDNPWKTLAMFVARALPELDQLSFCYPAGALQTASCDSAASYLRHVLHDKAREYEWLYFVSHSTGGIVVQDSLLRAPAGHDMKSVLSRTRLTLNICAPFKGPKVIARGMIATVGLGCNILGAVSLPAQKLVNFVDSTKPVSWGINRIPWQLWFRAAENCERDNEFRQLDRQFPQLKAQHMRGLWDEAANAEVRLGDAWFPWAHTSLLRAYSEGDLVVAHVVQRIKEARPNDRIASALCNLTHRVCGDLDREAHVVELTSDVAEESKNAAAEKEDHRRSFEGSWLGSQKAVFSELRERLQRPGANHYLLTGASGVGKSAVLRSLAQELSRSGDSPNALIPFWIPIYRFSPRQQYASALSSGLAGDNLGDAFLQSLRAFFVDGCHTLGLREMDDAWVTKTWKMGAAIMVDGVDDFFVRFRSELGDRAIQELVRAFSRQFPLCDVVFGIRSSMLNSAIPRFRGRTVEVACFSDAEVEKRIDAEKLPPELAAALKERARQRDGCGGLLRTPLVLLPILRRTGRVKELSVASVRQTGTLLEYVLLLALEDKASELDAVGVSPAAALDCVTIAGHVMFSRSWSQIAQEDLLRECQGVAKRIQGAVGECERRHFSTLDDSASFGATIAASRIFADIDGLSLQHREWEELLAARFLYWSARFGFAVEIDRRGADTRMFFMVGQLLDAHAQGMRVEAKWVRSIMEHYKHLLSQNPHDQYARMVLGNFLGIAGYWRAEWNDDAVDLAFASFLKREDQRPAALIETVALQVFGYRAVLRDDRFRRRFVETLRNQYPWKARERVSRWLFWLRVPRRKPDGTEFIQLVADCFSLALDRDKMAVRRLPRLLSNRDPEVMAALNCLSDLDAGQRRVSPVAQRMQQVSVSVLQETPLHPDKVINCVTYAVCLTAAYIESGILEFGTTVEVEALLTNDPPPASSAARLRKTIESYDAVPEIQRVWKDCIRLVARARHRQ